VVPVSVPISILLHAIGGRSNIGSAISKRGKHPAKAADLSQRPFVEGTPCCSRILATAVAIDPNACVCV
jgi:hypothetical protein